MTCIGSHFSIGGRERKENPEPGRQAGGRGGGGAGIFRVPAGPGIAMSLGRKIVSGSFHNF